LSSEETEDLRDLLDVKELDRDLFEAPSFPDQFRAHLFGGQVAAQALRAAMLTVAPDRAPHSLHGYFLRRGTSGRSTVLQVYRDFDGRSFSSRRVLAIQNGEVLFSAAASFHVEEPSPEYQPAMPDDAATHVCALTYVTDFGSGFAEVAIEGLAPAGPSLDHCIWFHRPIRLDDWVLVDLWPLRALGSRGTYMGAVHDRHGALGCMLAQEALLRPRSVEARHPNG